MRQFSVYINTILELFILMCIAIYIVLCGVCICIVLCSLYIHTVLYCAVCTYLGFVSHCAMHFSVFYCIVWYCELESLHCIVLCRVVSGRNVTLLVLHCALLAIICAFHFIVLCREFHCFVHCITVNALYCAWWSVEGM